MSKISLSSSAMLVEYSISCWSAKKLARKESEELTSAKAAAKNAAKVQKNLLADDKRLQDINKFAAEIRNWITSVTLPWSDNGTRLISTKQFLEFKSTFDAKKQAFDQMVADFLTIYPTLISAQAFKLGTMFDRNEYPSAQEIAYKFGIRFSFTPVPESGDFRVDIEQEIANELREEYEREYDRRVEEVNREHWNRLKAVLDRMSDRLGKNADGTNKKLYDTVIDNALELCDLLKDTNVTNDAKLEEARKHIEQALLGVSMNELRKNDAVREDVKERVDEILNKFNW